MSATISSPSKEQFCSFISEFIDKSKKIIVESEDVLDYDAVELTLLLKSIGFQLQSFEFESKPDEESREIEIEIKCKRSGMQSKLKMLTSKCTCPLNDPSSNNNSFWEVQGVSGTTKPSGLIQDTSCNLLPDITKKTNNLARTMLTILQQHYKADFDPKEAKIKQVDLKEILERFQKKTDDSELLTVDVGSTECVSPNNAGDKKTQHCSTPLNSNTPAIPIPAYEGNGITINLNPATNEQKDNESLKINLTNETEKNYVTTCETLNGVTLNGSDVVLKIEDTFDQLNPEYEKEIYLIENITEARKNLDNALLLLKCNVTREISPGSSILTVTPQNLKKKWQTSSRKEIVSDLMSLPAERPKTPNSNNLSIGSSKNLRRHSFGGQNDILPNSVSANRQRLGGSNLALSHLKKKVSPLGKGPKPDTPRPTEKRSYGIEASLMKKALSTAQSKTNTNLSNKPPLNKFSSLKGPNATSGIKAPK